MTETPEQAKKRQEKEALVLLFLLLVSDTHDSLSEQVTRYLSGSTSVHSLGRSFTATLFGAHVLATYYGRRAAGVASPMGESDEQFASATMRGQGSYITGLLNDLGRARYPLDADGNLPKDLLARILLYARRLRATMLDAWRLGLPSDTLIEWTLHPAEHCEDCLELNANGPYRAADLPTVPSAGDTKCLSNCACTLSIVNGETLAI